MTTREQFKSHCEKFNLQYVEQPKISSYIIDRHPTVIAVGIDNDPNYNVALIVLKKSGKVIVDYQLKPHPRQYY
jgi:hypothetical protein